MSLKDLSWRGQDSAWVLEAWLAAHVNVTALHLFRPSPPLPLQERVRLTPSEWDVVERGLELRGRTNLPFWDSVFVSSFASDTAIDGIFEAASFHNTSAAGVERLPVGENTAGRLRMHWGVSPARDYLAVLSTVECADGTRAHIPLLDFHIPPSDHGLDVVRSALKHAKAGNGYILMSGKSYHFYGDDLLDERALLRLLGRCLLFAPVIDRAWVAHQILELSCALRISPKASGGDPPRVVSRLG